MQDFSVFVDIFVNLWRSVEILCVIVEVLCILMAVFNEFVKFCVSLWRFLCHCGGFCVFVEVFNEFVEFCGVFVCIYGYFVCHCGGFESLWRFCVYLWRFCVSL